MGKISRPQFVKDRERVMRDLGKLEDKWGTFLFRSAMRRKMALDTARQKREVAILKMERELEQLKKGKLVV